MNATNFSMLKRITHIVVILLITVATTGFTISRHYCGNHLIAVSLFQSSKCDCGNKDCHTVLKQIKISDDFSTSEVIHSGVPTFGDLPFFVLIHKAYLTYPALLSSFFSTKAPPLFPENPFAILQSFRC